MPEPEPSRLTKYQKFRGQRVHRSQLRGAPYNPRLPLHPELAQRLRDNITNVGLVEPLTWNLKTGQLVGGHQRLAALDVLHGHGDYELDVAAVELDPKVEAEQNVFLNNPAVQSDWDLVALGALFKQPGFDIAAAGFADVDVLDIFGEHVYVELFGQPLNEAPAPADEADADVMLVLFASRADRERFMGMIGCEPDERYIDAARVLAELGVDANEPWSEAYSANAT